MEVHFILRYKVYVKVKDHVYHHIYYIGNVYHIKVSHLDIKN